LPDALCKNTGHFVNSARCKMAHYWQKITSYWSQDGSLFYIKSGSHVKQMIKSYTDFKGI